MTRSASVGYRRTSFKPADPTWDAEEARWMAGIATGGSSGNAALTCLMKAYRILVLQRLVMGGVDLVDAEDVAQEFWLELLREASSFRGEAPVRHYLFVRLQRAIARYHRDRKRAPPLQSLDEEDEDGETLVSTLMTPRSDTVWRDFKECVVAALAAFEREHPLLARLLLLRHVEELTVEEVAQEFGSTATKARDVLYSARRKFAPDVRPCLSLWPPNGGSA